MPRTATVEVIVRTKTLKVIQEDMSELYDQVRSGAIELKAASELANIAGKFLKAEQLMLMREMFLSKDKRFTPRLVSNE